MGQPHAVLLADSYEGPLPSRTDEADLPDPPGRLVPVTRRRALHVRDIPDAEPGAPDGVREPALYVHGLYSDSTYWAEIGHLLAGHFAGEALDLPGFGGSDAAPRNIHSLDGFVDVVLRYLQTSDRGPVHLAGNSLGGVIALSAAAKRPDLVRTLTLMSPAMPFPVLRPRVAAFGSVAMLPNPQRVVETGAHHVFGDPARLTPARRRRFERVFTRQKSLRTRTASVQSMASLAHTYLHRGESSLWTQAAQVRAPTLVVWGGQDMVIPPSLAPRLARTIPDSRLLMLDDVGHLPYVEAPEPVARAMLARALD